MKNKRNKTVIEIKLIKAIKKSLKQRVEEIIREMNTEERARKQKHPPYFLAAVL